MKKSAIALMLSAAGLIAAIPQIAQAYTAQQVLESISAHGLLAPHDLEREYGYWTAKATAKNGERMYVLINDANGKFDAISKTDLGTIHPSAAQVVTHLNSLGYAQVRELEFDDGFWEAKVRQNAQSPRQELHLHPVTLKVVHPTNNGSSSSNGGATAPSTHRLSAAEVVHELQRSGYTRITDLEFDDGVWEADATNGRGQRVDLIIHPETGAVLREKLDD